MKKPFIAAALAYSMTSQSSIVICPNWASLELLSEVLPKYYGSRDAASEVMSDPKYFAELTKVISHTPCTALPSGTKMEVEWDDVDMIWPVVTTRLPDGTEIHGVTSEVEPPDVPGLPPKLRGRPSR